MAQATPRVQLETGPNPEHCVIWLHGLGADGYDFVPLVKALEEFGVGPTRYVFPHAPKIPVSINGGYVMRAWYDIKNTDLMREEDAQGIKDSSESILKLIDEQIEQGFDSQNIVLAGFSQGGAITYHAGTRCTKPLGGLIALSCYLALPELLPQEKSAENASTPIFAAHGSNDTVVPCHRGELAANTLKSLGYSVQWDTYEIEHSISADEVQNIADFLKAVFI